jgi:transposase
LSPVRREGARRVLRGRRRSNAPSLPDYWAADALAELGATVHLAHPLGVKAFSYRRVKNDQRDAADLADLLRMGRLPHAWIAPPETRELRELVRHRAKLVAMRSQCKAHVHAVLAKGGIWVPMTDLFGVEGNLLLDKVTMPAPYKERIASLRRFIEAFDAEIDLFTALAQRRLARDAGYTAIQQIPGIGPVLGAVFVAEIGDVHRFARPAQLTCWAGLTPSHRESDTTVRRGAITKQGSRLVRWAAIESVKILPDTSRIGAIREQVAHRRGNPNIGAVAAARRQLELVFYGLRDHHIRALHRSPRAA